MGKSSLELRNEIERIRDDLDETLDELGDHVRPRRIYERRTRRFRGKMHSVREAVMGSAQGAMSSTQHGAQQVAGQVAGTVEGVADQAREAPEKMIEGTRGNPLAAGIIAFGAGLLLGSLAPATGPEQQAIGSLSQTVEPLKDKIMESAQQVQSAVGESARDAMGSVQQESKAAVDDLKAHAQQSAQDVKEQVSAGSSDGGSASGQF